MAPPAGQSHSGSSEGEKRCPSRSIHIPRDVARSVHRRSGCVRGFPSHHQRRIGVGRPAFARGRKTGPCPASTNANGGGGARRSTSREASGAAVRDDVLSFCRPELVDSNYFHAVLEATKSVGDRIRTMTGLLTDGAPLADEAFSLRLGPMLAFNMLRTETDKSEHAGLANIVKGMFGAFRNPTAHAPKTSWLVTEEEALDLLTLVSFLHRRLDAAEVTPTAPAYRP
jgi:uncharacterized protein (TIGR02391 family)